MNKIFPIFLMVILILLTGCNTEKKQNNSSEPTVLENSNIEYIVLQFKDNYMEFSDNAEMQSIKEIFSSRKLERDESLDGNKGWIYKIIASDSKKNQLEEISVIDENKLLYNHKGYTCEKIELSKLDELSGFNREN